MSALSPFVYWAQTKENVFLKIDLKDVKEPVVKINEKSLEFNAVGTGAQGSKEYSFALNFFDTIEVSDKNVSVKPSSVTVKLVKTSEAWWPRLISNLQKPTWLKIDFDKWQSEDDYLDEQVNDIRDDFPDIYEKLQKKELGYLKEDFKKVYLVFYNFLMLCGFTYIFCVMIMVCLKAELRNEGPIYKKMYDNVGQIMCILHLFQLLEILHPIFGYVKGNPLFPAMQIGGRILILFGNLEFEPRMQKMPVITYLFFAWTIIELLRYSYYIVNMTDNKRMKLKKYIFPTLEWLRYSAWIILYPWGYTCEVVIIFRNMIFLHEHPRWFITLPNLFNFTFDYLTCLRIYMLFFSVPGMYALLKHMYTMRVKKLGADKKIAMFNPFKPKEQ